MKLVFVLLCYSFSIKRLDLRAFTSIIVLASTQKTKHKPFWNPLCNKGLFFSTWFIYNNKPRGGQITRDYYYYYYYLLSFIVLFSHTKKGRVNGYFKINSMDAVMKTNDSLDMQQLFH